MRREQTTPRAIKGWLLVVVLDSDISHERGLSHIRDLRAAENVMMWYNYFSIPERPFGALLDEDYTIRLSREHYFPMIDLFLWFKKDSADYVSAVQLVQQYLEAVRPLIIVPYGQKPVTLAGASFETTKHFHNQPNRITLLPSLGFQSCVPS